MKLKWWHLGLIAAVAFALAYLWLERQKLQTVVENRGTLSKAGSFLDAGQSLWSDLRAKF